MKISILQTSDDQGVTLLEMLIVVAIAGLIASASLLYLPQLANRIALNEATSKVVRLLSNAATTARITGIDQAVRLDQVSRKLESTSGETVVVPDEIEMSWLGAEQIQNDISDQAFLLFATGGSSGGVLQMTRGTASARIEVDWLAGNAHEAFPK